MLVISIKLQEEVILVEKKEIKDNLLNINCYK